MSRENVELVRSAIGESTLDVLALFGDQQRWTEDANGPFELLADDAEIVFVGAEPGLVDLSYRGLAGLAEGWRDWLAPWRSYEAEPEEFVDAGQDVVLLARLRGETKHDGVTIEQPAAAIWTIEAGRVVRLVFHLDRRAALESVGRSDLLS
jgi:ketosteroid isomerase-like protein